MRRHALTLGLGLLVACGGKRSAEGPGAESPSAGTAASAGVDAPAGAAAVASGSAAAPDGAPGPVLVPATGRCAEQLVGAGPTECPYAPVARPAKDDLAAPFMRGKQCVSAGRLRVTSGHVVACDPLVFLQSPAFTEAFPPGAYPVILAMSNGDVTHALVRVGEARPVRWAQALLPGEAPRPGQTFGYPVDSGTGAYADDRAARTVEQRQEAIRSWCADDIKKRVDPADADAWHREFSACEDRDGYDLYQALRTAGYHTRAPWANACVDPDTGANLIVFTSGAGDGSYAVFIDYDADGKAVALVTDFGLARDDD